MIKIDSKNYQSENVLSQEEILKKINQLKKEGETIGFCSGSFDLLHPGHITHLISAKKVCDILIVAIAKDEYSSKKNIGSGRPIFSHDLRAFMISKLKPVDFVFLDDGSQNTINSIKPDIFIKGSDYLREKNPGILFQEKMMKSFGGKTYYTYDEKLSTTEIIKHIKEKIK